MNLRDLVAVLGHELRTPLAAILGYQELLADGVYGELEDRQREPVDRIQHSAQQLLHLIDGLQELIDAGSVGTDDHEDITIGALLDRIEAASRPYASGRSIKLETEGDPEHTLRHLAVQRFLRAADLALIACIKASHGQSLRMGITEKNRQACFYVLGTHLNPQSDDPAITVHNGGPPLSAARLRLAMARSTVRAGGGSLTLEPLPDSVTLRLQLPLATS